jgi:cytidylate kinase
MMESVPYIITISRQLGSGGGYLGRWLANRLKILYIDHEIIRHSAERLKVPVTDLEDRDEKVTSFWRSLLLAASLTDLSTYQAPAVHTPTDVDLYKVESSVIEWIAQKQSAVIVGRGGSWVLRDHPRHVSVFLHADTATRIKRIQDLQHISAQEAERLIITMDKDRARYFKALSGNDWLDATQYHLSLDTGQIDLNDAAELVLSYLQTRFHLTIPQD